MLMCPFPGSMTLTPDANYIFSHAPCPAPSSHLHRGSEAVGSWYICTISGLQGAGTTTGTIATVLG